LIAPVYGIRGQSAVHRFDPRGKIILLAVFLITFFLPLRIGHLGIHLAVVAALTVIFLGVGNALRPLRLILPILILVLVLTPPFHRDGPVLFSIRSVPILTASGLLEALRLIVRFTGITLIFYLFMGTTDPDSLVLAFRWFRLPFAISMVLSIAMEYIPTIGRLYNQVRDAHRLRLAGETGEAQRAPRSGRPRGKVTNKPRRKRGRRLAETIPILTSVLILSVRRIPTLAMALECRGVGRKNRRSSFHSLKTGASMIRDGMISAVIAAAVVVSIVLFP
jgi:energy-coupling factor transport system permease protein